MLKIIIELWPGGDESRKERIAEAAVWNMASTRQLPDTSAYGWAADETSSEFQKKPLDESGFVYNHNRFQTVWALVAKVSRNAVRKHTKEN